MENALCEFCGHALGSGDAASADRADICQICGRRRKRPPRVVFSGEPLDAAPVPAEDLPATVSVERTGRGAVRIIVCGNPGVPPTVRFALGLAVAVILLMVIQRTGFTSMVFIALVVISGGWPLLNLFQLPLSRTEIALRGRDGTYRWGVGPLRTVRRFTAHSDLHVTVDGSPIRVNTRTTRAIHVRESSGETVLSIEGGAIHEDRMHLVARLLRDGLREASPADSDAARDAIGTVAGKVAAGGAVAARRPITPRLVVERLPDGSRRLFTLRPARSPKLWLPLIVVILLGLTGILWPPVHAWSIWPGGAEPLSPDVRQSLILTGVTWLATGSVGLGIGLLAGYSLLMHTVGRLHVVLVGDPATGSATLEIRRAIGGGHLLPRMRFGAVERITTRWKLNEQVTTAGSHDGETLLEIRGSRRKTLGWPSYRKPDLARLVGVIQLARRHEIPEVTALAEVPHTPRRPERSQRPSMASIPEAGEAPDPSAGELDPEPAVSRVVGTTVGAAPATIAGYARGVQTQRTVALFIRVAGLALGLAILAMVQAWLAMGVMVGLFFATGPLTKHLIDGRFRCLNCGGRCRSSRSWTGPKFSRRRIRGLKCSACGDVWSESI